MTENQDETGCASARPLGGLRPSNDDYIGLLYRRHGATILARCRRLLKDAAAAEDATQEIFVRVARNADKVPRNQEVLFWLYRVATNHCLNELRALRRAPAALGDRAGATIPRHVASGEELLGDREQVRRVLNALPETLRVVAVLRHVEGLHDHEVARALGVSRRTVVYRLGHFERRARRVLGAPAAREAV